MNDLSIDKNKRYSFVFNSLAGVKDGLSANAVTYNIDWSVMPDQAYKVHLSYLGEVNNIDGAGIAMIYADLGVPRNVYEAGSPAGRTQANSSNFLGFTQMYLLGASSFLHAEDGTNPPIYISGRPRNTNPKIQIFNNNVPQTLFTPATGNLADYILTLHFVPADKSE